jgi:Phosphotransferase enzyme family
VEEGRFMAASSGPQHPSQGITPPRRSEPPAPPACGPANEKSLAKETGNDAVTPLQGGIDTPVLRVGDTVRRRTGSWTPAVHALLRHLEHVGFPGAPRVLGIDEQGCEILTYLPGKTIGSAWPWPAWTRSEQVMIGIARLLRRYHDAVVDFRPPPGSLWRFGTGAPGPGEIICHNDVGPSNVVYAAGTVRAFIDWDQAGPAPATWDLALAAWQTVPLHAPDQCHLLGWPRPPEYAERLRVFCDAYGLEDRAGFLALVRNRLHSRLDELLTTARNNDQTSSSPYVKDLTIHLRADLTFLDSTAPALQTALE